VNGGYVNSSLMKNEAILDGYDDAIALDAQGHVTEATVANVFIVRNGVLVTPGVGADLLEGITRASIITIARAAGMSVEERAVDRTELYVAHEAFLCGSSARLIPILSVDKRPVGGGAGAGPVTKTLLEKYEAAQMGTDGGTYKEWRMEV
jgi:branched-chain amino acid aminotransferase